MTRLLNWAFLTVGSLLLFWLCAMALIGSPPAWLAPSGWAHEALVSIGRAGLRAFPVLFPTALVLGIAWLWQLRAATRRVVHRER